MIEYILDDGEINKWGTSFFYFLQFYFDMVVDELIESLFHSSKRGVVAVNSFSNIINDNIKTNKVKEDLEYIMRLELVKEANIFPYPENFDDVLRFRDSKDLHRFREVSSNWLSVIKEGNEKAIRKIETDLIKANQQLKSLRKWKEYKDSQIYFWINSVGGHIPIISNILTLLFTADHFISRKIEGQNNWIMINR